MTAPDTSPAPPRFEFLWDDETGKLPPLQWLVDGMIPHPSTTVVVAPKESGKTAWAIGLALSIGSDTPHFDRATQPGLVFYLYAEGATGLHRRVEAWKRFNQRDGERCNVLFLPRPVQLLDPTQVEGLTRSIAEHGDPTLIIVDTIERNTPGGEENSKADQSRLVWAADLWKSRFGCTTMLIGHPTKARGKQLKGSESIENAADTIIRLERDGELITFHCEKQRDAEHFTPFSLELAPFAGSVVLAAADGANAPSAKLTALQMDVLQCLDEIADSLGCSDSRWRDACTSGNAMSRRTYYNARKRLLSLGYVLETRKDHRFMLTQEGHDLLQVQGKCKCGAIAPRAASADRSPSLRTEAAAVPLQRSEEELEREAIASESAA